MCEKAIYYYVCHLFQLGGKNTTLQSKTKSSYIIATYFTFSSTAFSFFIVHIFIHWFMDSKKTIVVNRCLFLICWDWVHWSRSTRVSMKSSNAKLLSPRRKPHSFMSSPPPTLCHIC